MHNGMQQNDSFHELFNLCQYDNIGCVIAKLCVVDGSVYVLQTLVAGQGNKVALT